MYDALPKNERTFHVDKTGGETGVKYQGDFTIQCVLDIGGRHAEEMERTRLLADYANPTPKLYGYATTLAKLRAHITDSPDWWKKSDSGATLRDEDIIAHLYNECLRLEKEWKEELKTASKKADQATSEQTPPPSAE